MTEEALRQIQFKQGGEKGTAFRQIRVTASQNDRLRALAESSGLTVTAYIKLKIFNELSTDIKLNKILQEIVNLSKKSTNPKLNQPREKTS